MSDRGYWAGWQRSVYLSQGALHPAQEVVVAGSDAVSAVDVVDFESELLHLLEVVVQGENLGKHRVQVALYDFCPVQLREETQKKTFAQLNTTATSIGLLSRGAAIHLNTRANVALWGEFCGLRHLISAYRKARAPLFNSLTRKAELFHRLMMLDLAGEHLLAAHLLTRANQMSLETASESKLVFPSQLKASCSCSC